jgi:hypothetical protein
MLKLAAEKGDLEKVKTLLEEAKGRGDKDFINQRNKVEPNGIYFTFVLL